MKNSINKKQIRNRMLELYLKVSNHQRLFGSRSVLNYTEAYSSIARILLLISPKVLTLSDRIEISTSISNIESYLKHFE